MEYLRVLYDILIAMSNQDRNMAIIYMEDLLNLAEKIPISNYMADVASSLAVEIAEELDDDLNDIEDELDFDIEYGE